MFTQMINKNNLYTH